MPRKTSFSSMMNQMAKDQARRERERQQKERQIEREALRLDAQYKKEAKQQYLENRILKVAKKNQLLQDKISALQSILDYSLDHNNIINFDNLRKLEKFRPFRLPSDLIDPPTHPILETVKEPTRLEKMIPGAEKRYQQALEKAKRNYSDAQEQYNLLVSEYNGKVEKFRDAYDQEKLLFIEKQLQHNKEVDEFEQKYFSGDFEAVVFYYSMLLEQSEFPNDFPQNFRIAYIPDPKELVVDYELPDIDIIPKVAEYQYVKSKDIINEKARKPTEIKDLYSDLVASICLRTIHEIFNSDQADLVQVVVFNGFVQSIDPSTGHDIRPYLISIRVIKDRFKELNLSRIDKRVCLRNLGAHVSSRPYEKIAVKPIVEFDMVDKRFVDQTDVIADLESRPNLMELNPFEFENLVSNLFEKIGFQSKQTRSSKDGGVDAIAFDPRPILGGKVVIQAKRYKNVVGVSAVRDLYGTMINEGANKGILVSTSHYGPDAYDFAKDKPIELIDGSGLLYLLDQQGISARIIFPED